MPLPPPVANNSKTLDARQLISYVLIALTLLLAGTWIALRLYYYEPINDDLLYKFILDKHFLGSSDDYSHPITSIKDAVYSQYLQYFHTNGRMLVHILVQMFAGPWNEYYPIFNFFLLPTVIILFAFYCIKTEYLRNPLIWVLVVILFYYLFPDNSNSFFWIAGGMNYLFPMLPSVIYLLYFEKFKTKNQIEIFTGLGLFILGFIEGWMMECFSVPLSGAIFFYITLKRFKVKPYVWIMAISLWIGTTILVLAPGNFVRLGQSGILVRLCHGLLFLLKTPIFWAWGVVFISTYFLSKQTIYKYIKNNKLIILALIVSIFFGMVANSRLQSFGGVAFFSALLLCRFVNFIPKNYNDFFKANVISCVLLLCLFSLHQYRIVEGMKYLKTIYQEFISDYLESTDGIVLQPNIKLDSDTKPYIFNWFESDFKDWLMVIIEKVYVKEPKRLFLLDKDDYDHYRMKVNEVERTGKYLWFGKEKAPSLEDTLKITFRRFDASEFARIYKDARGIPKISETKIPVDTKHCIIAPSGNVGIDIGPHEIIDYSIIGKGIGKGGEE